MLWEKPVLFGKFVVIRTLGSLSLLHYSGCREKRWFSAQIAGRSKKAVWSWQMRDWKGTLKQVAAFSRKAVVLIKAQIGRTDKWLWSKSFVSLWWDSQRRTVVFVLLAQHPFYLLLEIAPWISSLTIPWSACVGAALSCRSGGFNPGLTKEDAPLKCPVHWSSAYLLSCAIITSI